MRRSSRSMFLERLCELRSLYALRGDDDSSSVMSVVEAMRLVNDALHAESDVQPGETLSAERPA